jgi:phage tail-like protein
VNWKRQDPYPSFSFSVEIDNIIVASFSEVRGLQIEVETEPYREGGVNDFVHTFPKGIKYEHLVLKRGIAGLSVLDYLNYWYKSVMYGDIIRKNVTVILMDSAGNDRRRWSFKGAYPVKWTGPELKADSSTIAIESIELAHQGIFYVI